MTSKTPDEEHLGKYTPNKPHKDNWKKTAGAYITVVFEEDDETPSGVDIHTQPYLKNRIKVRLSWVKESDEIKEIEIKKFKHYKNDGWKEDHDEWGYGGIKLKPVTTGLILEFLRTITSLDINEIKQRRMSLNVEGDLPLDDQMKRQLRTYLSKSGGREFIQELLSTGFLQAGDIVNTSFRREQLEQFERMLSDPDTLKAYARSQGVSETKEEGIWQRFFEQNQWIFGYGLDYRFQGLLQSQPSMSSGEADGSDYVISDFLLGDSQFMVFVEIKKPSTLLFTGTQNRARSWRLSSDLFDSVSQILEQKAGGQSFYEAGDKFNNAGQKIVQRPHDSKVLLIIGSWDQITQDNEKVQDTKRRTLELFRRDSRNVEILTYDELLDRARFIVEHSSGQ